MIDIKSKIVLTILAKEASNGGYKIFEIPDIIQSMPKHYRIDTDAVKHILSHLERQDIISIKYDDDDTYCIAVLPYGYEILENMGRKNEKTQTDETLFKKCFYFFLSALFGGIIASILIFIILKIAKI